MEMFSLTQYNGPVWRLLPKEFVDKPSEPAKSPIGRFHHSGQIAAYASLTAEGAAVAIQRYLSDGRPRFLIPMWLNASCIADERGNRNASIVWQDIWEAGNPSPTWEFSDAARKAGKQAMLYSSRSRPEISHVVVFDTGCLTYVGPTSQFNSEHHYIS